MNDLYKESGVDINNGNQISKFIKDNSENIGSFGAICNIPNNINNPVVVSSNDGVGTKLLLTNELKKWDTIGIDCVAMCVNTC
ncbi:hypothetical protein [Lactobacillus terrae]|uniref:hypothetical protein n=1 Tax=Lactobacillus terrae TaxID=2269374 RepID=UPI000C1B603E|nr:hypothetical protein [Lactobacillus terrae]